MKTENIKIKLIGNINKNYNSIINDTKMILSQY